MKPRKPRSPRIRPTISMEDVNEEPMYFLEFEECSSYVLSSGSSYVSSFAD